MIFKLLLKINKNYNEKTEFKNLKYIKKQYNKGIYASILSYLY